MSINDVVEATDIPLNELNRVFLDFGMAGMISIQGRQVRFTDARNPALRHLVMSWAG
ncbi:MAG: hypothetical protein IID35_03270 [Planctomycetes bacterium]|nr:hypothetical protein [Planctomycetota bacterium]